jgi:hypothetical protein
MSVGRNERRQRAERIREQRAERIRDMTTTRATARKFTARRNAPGLAPDIAELFQTLAKALFDPYRPELHYMRGPGPKWHAKHDRAPAELHADMIPALIPARVRR